MRTFIHKCRSKWYTHHIYTIFTNIHTNATRRLFVFLIQYTIYFNFHPLDLYARSQCTPAKPAKWCANSEQQTKHNGFSQLNQMHVLQYPYDMCVNPLALTERQREKKKGAIDFNDEDIGRNVKFESFGNLRNFHWLDK